MLREADLVQLAQIASTYPSRERFLTELTLDPPDATSDRAGDSAARRGLSDPFDHPLGEGAGVEVGLHSQCGRRLSSVGPRHRDQRRDRGGAAAALCRDDARQGSLAPDRAAALLCAGAAQQRRPSPLRVAHALHSRQRCWNNFESCAWPPAAAQAQRQSRRARRSIIGARVRRSWG